MERLTYPTSNMTPNSFQGFTQKPGIRLSAIAMGLLLLSAFWWKGLEGLGVLGGLTTLYLMSFGIHRFIHQNFDFARLIASSDDRDDDVRIEETVYWAAWAIGASSWLSVFLFSANPVLTLAVNSAVAFSGKYVANKTYAMRNADNVDFADFDESATIERLKNDPVQIGSGRAFISGIGIGAALVHSEPLMSYLAGLGPLAFVGYLTVLVPMLVFFGMTVAGKIDTVWAPERLFQREIKRRRRNRDQKDSDG